MPWPSGKGFAAKHNKKLKGTSAKVAAKVAMQALGRGLPEGEAIREGNAVGDRLYHGKGIKGFGAAKRTGKTRTWTGL